MKRINVMLLVGGVISVAGLAALGTVLYFYIHSHYVGNKLIQEATHSQKSSNTVQSGSIPVSYKTGGLIGLVKIPKIQLSAPIVEGTDQSQIDVAAGHLTTSALPGNSGTSVIAAHNATWFRHVDQLKSGDQIDLSTSYGTFTFRVTGSKIVHTGDPIYNTVDPSLVLESCYPLNALYLTPYRYLVYAELVHSKSTTQSIPHVTQSVSYHTSIPPSIPLNDTLLSNNALPMGTLSYLGTPSPEYVQSNSPLSASSALVQLYLAWLHASALKDQSALKQLGTQEWNPLFGDSTKSVKTVTPFDVTLDVKNGFLKQESATVEVRADHNYRIIVNASCSGNEIKLVSIYVRRVS